VLLIRISNIDRTAQKRRYGKSCHLGDFVDCPPVNWTNHAKREHSPHFVDRKYIVLDSELLRDQFIYFGRQIVIGQADSSRIRLVAQESLKGFYIKEAAIVHNVDCLAAISLLNGKRLRNMILVNESFFDEKFPNPFLYPLDAIGIRRPLCTHRMIIPCH